jgi:hypothetical protein
MNNSNLVTEQNEVFQEDKPKKKKIWLWWLGGCGLLACIAIGIIAYFLFSSSNETYPLNGNVSLPSTVKQGDKFDFVVTLTNPTTKPILIRHIVLHAFLSSPSLLDGARVISVEPAMDSERLYDYKNDVQFAYFQEIQSDETLTFTFHMQAEKVGTYIENVGVYTKHPFLPDPNFKVGFYVQGLEIEITP